MVSDVIYQPGETFFFDFICHLGVLCKEKEIYIMGIREKKPCRKICK